MNTLPDLTQLSHEQLLEFTRQLAMQHQSLAQSNQQLDARVQHLEVTNQHLDSKVQHLSILNQKYEHELALFKRHKFAQKNEHLTAKQIHLWDEAVEEDIAAVDLELERLNADKTDASAQKATVNKPKRRPLPDHLASIRIEHEPESTQCACGCTLRRIGEDISEKLNFRPAQFYKEQHVRGKWVCDQCDTLTQQAMPAYVIDKGIASPELLSHVLVSKYADHLPLYRQRQIFLRAGVDLSRSTLSDWIGRCGVELEPLAEALKQIILQQQVIHADETPVTIMQLGDDEKKPKKGYVWAYATTQYNPIQAVIYDFQPSRSGQHAEDFLTGWQGHLVCDDYSGYKARFKTGQVIEVGCMAHARRKFHELHVTKKSFIAEQALQLIQQLYQIEAELRELPNCSAEQRHQRRQQDSQPIMRQLYAWLEEHQDKVPKSSPAAKAINYSLKRWSALSRYLDDGNLPICNNWVENQMRPWALGRKNWLFAGSLRSGQRAANIMTLIQSAKLNGLVPYAYLSDVLKRLPTHKMKDIEALLPHNWKPA
ncbi:MULTISPECIES: IS66 family transposase [Acinetobacter]|uniref:IS66 family transposase n=1 Tax=Acinetobacter TaxID=469 RepID=UPI001F1A28A7|nr:IS66 family transposase [Acinetobacter johnsonii]MDO7410168.1 IS66 family transposase [Acinetobacter baumannii]UIZ97662.1 IS66 family transposase [Acinetobacter johnsonii]